MMLGARSPAHNVPAVHSFLHRETRFHGSQSGACGCLATPVGNLNSSQPAKAGKPGIRFGVADLASAAAALNALGLNVKSTPDRITVTDPAGSQKNHCSPSRFFCGSLPSRGDAGQNRRTANRIVAQRLGVVCLDVHTGLGPFVAPSPSGFPGSTNCELRLTSITRSQYSSGCSAAGLRKMVWYPLKLSAAAEHFLLHRATLFFSEALTPIMSAPLSAKAVATALPMPRRHPGTRAVLPNWGSKFRGYVDCPRNRIFV
jgi:hypothetical protein